MLEQTVDLNGIKKTLESRIEEFPPLYECLEDCFRASLSMIQAYNQGAKVLVCGNGGSAADSDHIVGELMKSFQVKRPLNDFEKSKFEKVYGSEGGLLASMLEKAFPAISLTSAGSLITAIANDIDSSLIFAQQVYGYGAKGDILLAISTSGNSENIIKAVMVGKTLGLTTILLTGRNGGKLSSLCDIVIKAPSNEVAVIQAYHVVAYHAICAAVEASFFDKQYA